MPKSRLLNTQTAQAAQRLSLIVSVLTLAGAGLIFFLVKPPQASIPMVEAMAEPRPTHLLTYPHYSFFTTKRHHIFAYGQLDLTHRDYEKKDAHRPPKLPPGPDVSGLVLAATMPGDKASFAIIRGLEDGRESLVALGEKVRDSKLAEIASDKIVLARNAQNATLALQDNWRSAADELLQASHLEPAPEDAAYAYPGAPAATAGPKQAVKNLGLFMAPLSDQERMALDLAAGVGLEITQINRKDLHIETGDLLVAVEGKPVGQVKQVLELVQNGSGKGLYLTLIRKGHPLNVLVSPR